MTRDDSAAHGGRTLPVFLTIVMAFLLVTWPAGASAEEGFGTEPFGQAANVGRGLLDVESASTGRRHEWSASLLFNVVHDPLVVESHEGLELGYVPASRRVVGSQTAMHFLGSYAATDWLELGLDLPVVVHQSGDELSGLSSPSAVSSSAGVGDLRLIPKIRLLETRVSDRLGCLRLGVLTSLALPTGSRERFQGSGGAIAPRAALEWVTPVGPRLVANLGYSFRRTSEAVGLEVASTFAWAVGLEVPILGWARVLATVGQDVASEASLAVAASFFGVELLAGVAAGLPDDPLSPTVRAFFGGGYRWQPPRDPDSDGDGIPDRVDECPAEAEDRDGFEDDDGCPEADNDGDGVLDAADRCPLDAEDPDGFEDDDGCPEADNDGDGVTDGVDRCPADVEDRDGFEDDDGCPDADNDHDGLVDGQDRCPLDGEDFDGDMDDDGCPDTSASIAIDVTVYFDLGSSEIPQPHLYPLSRVARTIDALPDHLHVWIEGYADDTGAPQTNQVLSMERAQAVHDFLADRGVPRERMTPQGFGDRVPLYQNETDADRQVNRRVEFRVAPRRVSDEAAAAPAPPRRGEERDPDGEALSSPEQR